MSFMGHLEALRWHLVRAAAVIMAICIVAFFYSDRLFKDVVLAPTSQSFPTYDMLCKVGKVFHAEESTCITVDSTKKLQTLGASEQFSTYVWICMLAGIILGFPYLLYELWKFVRPALKSSEAKPVRGFVLVGSVLFLTGTLFGYFILFPLSYNFLIKFQISPEHIETNNTLDDYISLLSTMALVTGLVFELPILVYFLSRIGILTPKFMRKYRKHAVVILLILAAVITPSPDWLSQMIVFIPLFLLYEISIFVSANVVKKYNLEQ
ncbi:MAG: twin-arginine translocase subunit TatC [Bacteroidia bacterium]|nr:twin-arginine translocase subunit TatC [Bacteroidia bacterium]